MPKSRIFFFLSVAFLGGVFSASFYYPDFPDDFHVLVMLSFAAIIIALYWRKPSMILGFMIMFFLIGSSIVFEKMDTIHESKETHFSGQVMVDAEPIRKNKYQQLVVDPLADTDMAGKLLMNAGIYPDYHYGDILIVSCALKIPDNSEDKNFDYKMYLAKEGIYYLCQKPDFEVTGENRANKTYAWILDLKEDINVKITSLLPFPQSGLLSGLILGGDDLMSGEYKEAFSKTGTTHIVAVSGYNVTIIAEYLMLIGILLGLWRQQAFWFAVTGIIFFVVLVGMPSSAVRAGVMGILLIWAIKNGRLVNAQNAILFAASIMLLGNPLLLRWDIGFQLSFLATLGVVYVYPVFNHHVVKNAPHRSISTITEILMLTIAAQVFVLPIIFLNFGQLSLISPLANLSVLPIIPITMLLGFITIVLSFILPPLSHISAWLSFLPLKYETTVIKFLSGLKYASLGVENFPWWGASAWYIMVAIALVLLRKRMKNNNIPKR